jgi:ribonucleotide reductase alpha subunit
MTTQNKIDLYKQLSTDRKLGIENGTIPPWYTTAGLQLFKDRYLYKAANIKEQFERIANTAAKHLAPIGMEEEGRQQFFKMLWEGDLSPSTPVLSNMGTDRGMPVSCSGQHVPDSIDGFYSSYRETAILTKNSFGTSAYLGDIRARGSKISGGGKASGVLPVFKHFVQDMRDVVQGTRRGAWAGYLEIDHGDFDELADFVFAEPDDANVGWIIKDSFIAKLEAKDPDSIRRYQKAMKLKMVTGRGYFCFIDKINAKRPQAYVNNNLTVKASNLCFTGDTLVAVNGKVKDIASLAKESQGVSGILVHSAKWNHIINEWEKTLKSAVAFKTGTSKTIVVNLSNGKQVKCTPDHRLALTDGTYIPAKESIGKQLVSFFDEVVYVDSIAEGTIEDVYDLTVEDNHNFYVITNPEDCSGILVHNCDEITLFADHEHTFSCVLSSLNVVNYDKWKDTKAAWWSTVFLDCVAQEFIEKAKNIPGLESVVRFTEKGRALGLGQCGFHTYLQNNMIAFESFEAHMKSNEIAAHIFEEALEASKWLAEKFGEPEWCKGLGVRNTHLIAVAPTKSCVSKETNIVLADGSTKSYADLIKDNNL